MKGVHLMWDYYDLYCQQQTEQTVYLCQHVGYQAPPLSMAAHCLNCLTVSCDEQYPSLCDVSIKHCEPNW